MTTPSPEDRTAAVRAVMHATGDSPAVCEAAVDALIGLGWAPSWPVGDPQSACTVCYRPLWMSRGGWLDSDSMHCRSDAPREFFVLHVPLP